MLNAPNNQYGPMVPPMQMQPAAPQFAPVATEQGQQPAQGGLYTYPMSSCYMPPTSDFNGVKLIINNPQGYAAAGAPVPVQNGAVPASLVYPQQTVIPQQMPIVIPQQQNTQPAQTPEPVVKTEPAQNKPEIQEPTQELPGQKVQSFAAGLKSNDINTQSKTMEDIYKAISSDDKLAIAMQNEEIYDALINILSKDTSSLQGPSVEILEKRKELMANAQTPEEQTQVLIQTLSEKEAMLLHQRDAIFTIARLQNAALNVSEKNGSQISLNTLPAIGTIVDTVKENPEPILRAGALQALSHIARPYFKTELEQIFNLATSDSDEGVQELANNVLTQLQQL